MDINHIVATPTRQESEESLLEPQKAGHLPLLNWMSKYTVGIGHILYSKSRELLPDSAEPEVNLAESRKPSHFGHLFSSSS
jgi:hypothetical protein